MKTIKATELLCAGFEAHEEELQGKIKENVEYQKANEEFSKHLNTLKSNYSYMSAVEDYVNTIEIIARDTAFDEGFKLGVQLIVSSLK